jgi:hypothetical protein
VGYRQLHDIFFVDLGFICFIFGLVIALFSIWSVFISACAICVGTTRTAEKATSPATNAVMKNLFNFFINR